MSEPLVSKTEHDLEEAIRQRDEAVSALRNVGVYRGEPGRLCWCSMPGNRHTYNCDTAARVFTGAAGRKLR